jgi:ectoine hydroxylase-related dioxygenase (phytanoyl-CoA dioxygenase family)
MNPPDNIGNTISAEGFAILNDVFTTAEADNLLHIIESVDTSKATFRKTNDLFAIRQFLKEIPVAANIVFNKKLTSLIEAIFGNDFFVVKSIYFDKPQQSNWFVSYHQDLTISVNKKIELEGFNFWTTKHNQFAVQPPADILKDNFTIRIHLDDTNEQNGALKVIPQSHLKDIYRPETIDWEVETEHTCSVNKGGVMFMKPLLLHSSGKTTNNNKRRVIHIEFSRTTLPGELQWAEYFAIDTVKEKEPEKIQLH